MAVVLAVSSSIAVPACIATEESESISSELGAHQNDSTPRPNAVTEWNRIAANTLVAFPPAAGGAAPALQIHLAMVQGAVYDAVNAITPKHHRPLLLQRRFSARASQEAAVATAAYRVLSHIVETVPGLPDRQARLDTLQAEYEASLAEIPDCVFKRRGIEAGDAAADAMIDAREHDGRFGPSQWVPNANPGHWNPVMPNGMTMNDPTPWVGGVTPFLIESATQFQGPGPNELTSTAYAADVNEVMAIGGDGVITPSTRTDTQTHHARWWQSNGGPSLMWSGAARSLAEESNLDLADTARLLAMMNLSGADASITCWSNKYHFDFWRPFQAIRGADLDNNQATERVDGWTPLLSAPYPDHTSGHMCIDGAHTRILQMFFGTGLVHFGVTSSQFGGETRFFDSFAEPLDEIVEARIWAGLHFRTADVAGRNLGINVANYVADNYFQPVGKQCGH